jgi:CBS domain-containing protein
MRAGGTSGRVMRVASATDVLQASAEKVDAVAQARLFDNTMVREIMSLDAHVVRPEADVREAAKFMLYTEVRRLFVEDHGRLVGVISQTDVAQAMGSGRI